MKIKLVRLLSIILFGILSVQTTYADIVTEPDFDTPKESFPVMIWLGILVVFVALGSYLVLRTIRKRHAAADSAPTADSTHQHVG